MTRPCPPTPPSSPPVPLDPPHAARLDASDRRVAWIAGLIAVAVGVAVIVMMSR
jgi:predicted cobalt transporter CbtA